MCASNVPATALDTAAIIMLASVQSYTIGVLLC
jgi:hypothetical protein